MAPNRSGLACHAMSRRREAATRLSDVRWQSRVKVVNGASPTEYSAAPPSRERSAHATLWTLVELGGGQGASFLVFLVIARMIGPAEYGIFALALSLLTLLTIVQYYGFADAIIQRTEIDPGFLDTVFWCDVILSLC